MAFEELYGLLADNAAAAADAAEEADRPTFCPHDGERLKYRTGLDGALEAVCPLGNYSWP